MYPCATGTFQLQVTSGPNNLLGTPYLLENYGAGSVGHADSGWGTTVQQYPTTFALTPQGYLSVQGGTEGYDVNAIAYIANISSQLILYDLPGTALSYYPLNCRFTTVLQCNVFAFGFTTFYVVPNTNYHAYFGSSGAAANTVVMSPIC